MTDDVDDDWRTADEKAAAIARARELKDQAREGGLRFDAYLPPSLAEWLLGLVETGIFVDPSEAVFVILGEQHDLEPHADLRRELLKRTIQASIDDPRPSIPAEEVFERVRQHATRARSEPAEWWSTRAMRNFPPAMKSIGSGTDYKAALSRLDMLMHAEPGTPEGNELDVLADLIDLYELRQLPEFAELTSTSKAKQKCIRRPCGGVT